MSKKLKEKYEKACNIKDKALCLVEEQLEGDLSQVDAKELGEVADIAKDMAELIELCAEAEYYYKVVEAMEESSDEEKSEYLGRYVAGYKEATNSPMYDRDPREGKSGIARKAYMNMKESGADKSEKIKEIKEWVSDFTEDIMEMLEGASSEEKSLLKQHLTQLVQKIS